MGLHSRYKLFLGGFKPHIELDSSQEQKIIKAFKNMMTALFRQKGAIMDVNIIASNEAQQFINTHADILNSSFNSVKMTDGMRRRLQSSNYIFSGLKAFHEMNEAFPSLIDENGNRKPFEQFYNDVQKINQTYNRNYLRAEYNFVHASAQMAAKWEQYAEDGDRYYLQYRTAGDDKVRPEHAALNGVTLPQSDPFWETYYPPNGWNCRCTVVQVRKSKYPQTPRNEAMARGQEALQNDTKGLFRFNSGKQQKAVPDYNPYTIKRCRDCDIAKGKVNLAFVPENDLCAACRLVRDCLDKDIHHVSNNRKYYEKLKGSRSYKDVEFDSANGGIKATHVGHIDHNNPKEEKFFNGKYSSTDLEKECQENLFSMGHSAILMDESKRRGGKQLPALDLELDGRIMDIRSVTGYGWYSNIFFKKDNQLRRYNQREDIVSTADSLCLYFHSSKMFDEHNMSRSIKYYKYFRKNDGLPLDKQIKHVYCVINGESTIRVYDI